MATEYTQAGFNLNTSAPELSGVAHKILTFEKHAANQQTKDIFKSLKTSLATLDSAIKKAQNAAASKALVELLAKIKADYSAIASGVKTFINSPDATKKNAAAELAKRTGTIGSIFKGKTNEQLGNALSQIELLKKAGTANLKALSLDIVLARMEDLISNYQKNYSAKIEEATDNKPVISTIALEAVKTDLRTLRKVLTAYQVIGPNEEKLVIYLNNTWKEAAAAQATSAAFRKKNNSKGEEN